jgi:hypothetical protein
MEHLGYAFVVDPDQIHPSHPHQYHIYWNINGKNTWNTAFYNVAID